MLFTKQCDKRLFLIHPEGFETAQRFKHPLGCYLTMAQNRWVRGGDNRSFCSSSLDNNPAVFGIYRDKFLMSIRIFEADTIKNKIYGVKLVSDLLLLVKKPGNAAPCV